MNEDQSLGESHPTNNVVTTSCKNCAFAHYIENTQVSCDINRIDKFKENGVKILEAEDNEKEFYVIQTLCSGFRSEAWEEAHRGKDLIELFEKESSPRIGFMILLEEEKDPDQIRDDISVTIKSILESLKYPPRYVVIVSNISGYFALIESVQTICSEYDIDYRVMKITEKTSNSLDRVDSAFVNARNGFYCVLRAGDSVFKNMDEILAYAINAKLMNVGMIKGEDEVSMMTVQCTLHKHLHGNLEATLESKINNIQNEDGSKCSLIHTWEQLSDVFTQSNSPSR